jgi:capsular polysaccharide transport system permease protein
LTKGVVLQMAKPKVGAKPDGILTLSDHPRFSPAAGPAKRRTRHFALILSFVLWVVCPLGAGVWYLYAVALDQYTSHVGFSVQREDAGAGLDILGGLTALSGSSSSDTDILYEFIRSRQMVQLIDDRLDLQKIYRRPIDPIFALGNDGRIEALSRHWQRVVDVHYDHSSGLIELHVRAFTPEDAYVITSAIFEESSAMINALSSISRQDIMRYTQDELAFSSNRLKDARAAIIEFQNRTQIVDPTADLQGQMGLLNSLQTQLANASIEFALLMENSAGQNGSRVEPARRKIAAIQRLIEEERATFSDEKVGGVSFSQLLAEFQGLKVEQEFAEVTYLSAQAAHDAALAEAQHKSRYLATYMAPTYAQTAEYPRRLMLSGILAGFLLISWAILVMVYFTLRDRR